MQTYEAVVILNAKMTEEETTEVNKKVTEVFSSNGEVVSVDDWKTKKLAYVVKHETEGRYFLYTFNAEANHVAEIERLLRINASVLKYMIIKK